MFYRMDSGYCLRGWQKKAYDLIRKNDNAERALTRLEFEVLLLCDGETDLDTDDLTPESRQILKKLEQEGIVRVSHNKESLDDFQRYHYYDNRYVESVLWSITGLCNYQCRHCYMDAPDGMYGQLSTEKALSLIDQMADCGVLRVEITGGEPFVRHDFWQLVDYLNDRGIVIKKIYTNGKLLTETILDAFENRGLKPMFSFSFDGIGWHDWMRGITGAEDAVIRAMRLCKQKGYSTDVEMCIHRGNVSTLAATIELLDSIDVKAIKVGPVANTALWLKNCCGYQMTMQEYYEEMIAFIPKCFQMKPSIDVELSSVITLHSKDGIQGSPIHFSLLAEKFDGTEKCQSCYLCGEARWNCYITPEGRLLPCMPMTASPDQNEFPLIQDIGLRKGLSDSYYMQFVDNRVKDLLTVNAECAACEYRYKCGGGCRASALVECEHNIMGADRSQCILWKEGYAERIRQAAEEAFAKYCQ